ncbi:hypothetical protein SODALDRAFT_324957 [Sodiomyces alkalinus F11]|uniref:Uncharacterized protein n=1 Tax=Sodiomyces alkalinus (strain CBS 110278 / VKM F-3762 / F11) TaxID=1314773 RepID=A0A3N2PSN4_SODAK|nr:hypothetical protein SODALDRAFT_324957 [Sodiomyces alkalinus F11]ROT37336.1 hypothetical protein SODALDRAFT_324957 [Sodiomyces alkalinus F11]
MAMPSYRGANSDCYPPELNQPTMTYMPNHHWAGGNASMPRAPRSDNIETMSQRKLAGEPSYPATLNRPRKLSMATSSTATPVSSTRDSFEIRSRSSSWSSQTSFQSNDSLGGYSAWRPEYAYSRPSPIRTNFTPIKRLSGELFAALPSEVLELILEKLQDQHMSWKSDSCTTCAMRDLCSIASTCRRWHAYATRALYENIRLNGADSAAQKKRHKITFGSRLVLLRRTLRANTELAAMVRTLKVPIPPEGPSLDDYHNLVATLVMACPNFERLLGLNPRFDHGFSKLFHALSTRQHLKQIDWILESPGQQQQQQRPSSRPGSSSGRDSTAFLDLHVNWTVLTTLSIHSLPRATQFPNGLITRTSRRLPALQHLYLSRLSHAAFDDRSLCSLPPLQTLSLSHLPGVTSRGLSVLATRPASQAMTKLTLRHVKLDSLPALARIFSNLTRLHTFSLVQTSCPTLPEDTMIWLMPYLASPSLKKLHWDITTTSLVADPADQILARSVTTGGFPALRTLRAPNDPEGVFQSLCRPMERVEIVTDRFLHPGRNHFNVSSSGSDGNRGMGGMDRPQSPPRTPTTPTAPSTPTAAVFRDSSDLREARLAAQARLEEARQAHRFLVRVVNEDGVLVDEFGLAGFLGTLGSPIRYMLLPDAGARDDKGGLVDMDDVMGHCGEDISDRKGCCGRWNMTTSGYVDRIEKEKWWHTERGRWMALDLA